LDHQHIYLQTKPSRLFVRAALPGGISMLASSLYGVFEAIFVGRFLGTTAFAALGLAFPIVIMNFALAELVGVGSSVPIAIFLGQKEEDKANNYFTCSVLLTVMTGILSGVVIYFGAPYLLRLLGAKESLLTMAMGYLRVYAVCSPLAPLMFSMDNYLRICGKTKTSMVLNICTSAVTVLLELILIRCTALGLKGAALGSCIAMIAMVFAAVVMFVPGCLQLKFVRPRFSLAMFAQIYRNGVAPFMTNISGRLFSVIMNGLLLRFGGEAGVAVYGVIMTVVGTAEQMMYGVVDSLQPAIGYNYGAGRFDRVRAVEGYVLCTAAGIALLFGAGIALFPKTASMLFLEDRDLLPLAVLAVRISCISFLFKWFAMGMQCFFMALEKPMRAMAISMASACVIPLLLIPPLLPLELTGLWWNYPLTAVFSAALALCILLRSRNTLFF